jgi:two-component system, NtrC family, response regulator AtoC
MEAASRVLIVDDEENIRHMLTLTLRKEGYLVKAVPDGQAALDELNLTDYALVLCDIRMPKLDGMGLLAELQKRRVATTVIMMSAYADVDDALAAIKAGAYDYIAKPFRKEEILLTLRKAEERRRLRNENEALRIAARGGHSFASIIARGPSMRRVFETIQKVADYKSTVLIAGESGTGKEMVARALHTESSRRDKPFVTVNCGAIPENLLESELFGHVKGAFTDASRDKKGLFEEADTGTLFLDEIGDLPLALQVKLLRVLQQSEIRRVGDNRTRPIDVRVVAASLHELSDLVRLGRFREDLFYRLNVLPIRLPPLRERREDIALLVEHFVARYNALMGNRIQGVSPQAMAVLTDYHWPGNVRELENVIERAMVLSETDVITVDSLPENLQQRPESLSALFSSDDLSVKKATRAIEQLLIRKALQETGGNRTAAARILELSHRALLYKLKEYFPDGVPGE